MREFRYEILHRHPRQDEGQFPPRYSHGTEVLDQFDALEAAAEQFHVGRCCSRGWGSRVSATPMHARVMGLCVNHSAWGQTVSPWCSPLGEPDPFP